MVSISINKVINSDPNIVVDIIFLTAQISTDGLQLEILPYPVSEILNPPN
jgi:hypothetical protein